ncbi:hypothetical protein D3C85_1827580 [compost metagenome]
MKSELGIRKSIRWFRTAILLPEQCQGYAFGLKLIVDFGKVGHPTYAKATEPLVEYGIKLEFR